MATTFNLNNTFWAADDVKQLTFQGNDVDELTINGNTVLLPLDFTATLKSLNNAQTITFPTTKSKLARGLLIHFNAKKIGSTGRAYFNLSYTNNLGATLSRNIYTINRTSSNTEDILVDLWYNGSTCMLGGGPILSSWASTSTYLNLTINGVSNLYLNEPLTIRVVSDWESREEEDTSTTTTTKTTEATATAAADDYGFTLIDE